MIVTDIVDSEPLKLIHDDSFPFPNLKDSIAKQMVIDNGVLVGAGLVRLTTEGILVIDKNLPVTTKIRAVKALIEKMVPQVRNLGIEECHVFVKDYKMANFLEEIGFQHCKGGQPMILYF